MWLGQKYFGFGIDIFPLKGYTCAMGLVNLTKNYQTVAILGTCKNAGKTTALNLLLNQDGLAITSIGLDGETTDSVTGTEKPRIFVKSGTLVATAVRTLSDCTPTKEILCATGIPSPLGEIVVFRCVDDGFVKIAGPSIAADMLALKSTLFALGAKRVLIDGALSRRAIATSDIVDGIVIATGASYHADMNRVLDDTALLLSLYGLPSLDADVAPSQSLTEDVKSGKRKVYTDGAITDGLLKSISSLKQVRGLVLGVQSPAKILASSQAVKVFLERGGAFRVKDSVKVIAVTVNPCSAYGWQFDKDEFLRKMRERTDIPVMNVLEEQDEL